MFDRRELALRWSPPDDPKGENAVALAERARRRAMAQLCVTPSCRFRVLLAELGEASGDCGRCDHCRGGVFALGRRLNALVLGWRAAADSRITQIMDRAAPQDFDEPPPVEAQARETPASPEHSAPLRICDERLQARLIVERLALARRRGVPPRRIASDGLLAAMAIQRPKEASDLLFVEGEGAALSPDDVARFLNIIATSDDL